MRTAARVARTFGLDPVVLLADADPLRWSLRIAAHNVIMDEEQAAADRMAGR